MEGLIIPSLGTDLVIPVAFDWPSPDRILEAIGDSTAKRAQRANRAGTDVIAQRFKLERETQQQILARLKTLKDALGKRLLVDQGGLTDFRQATLTALTADVDRLVAQTGAALGQTAERDYKAAGDLALDAVQEPLTAAQLHVTKGLPGLDTTLVQAAFGNTVDLLTLPMQQYATQVKVALRGVALAGDSKFAAIAKLRDQIGGPSFAYAQYQAERIIRTELGRTFNQATYDRLLGLTKDFPFLRKGWRAAGDNRTRLGHVQAGRTYARGQGIPVADRFEIQVYDQRPGKSPTLIGVCTLRFPVDPDAKPAGRLAAASTILCRCNGFVDFNLTDFASFTKSKVALAIGKPAAAPGPVAVPAGDDVALAKSLKGSVNYYQGKYFGSKSDMQTILDKLGRTGAQLVQGKVRGKAFGFWSIEDGAGATFGPSGWKMPRAVGVKRPTGLPIPKPATVTPTAVAAVGPQGSVVSAKLAIPKGPRWESARRTMAALDKVHGDGPLEPIPLKQSASRKFYGQMSFRGSRLGGNVQATALTLSNSGLAAHPHNTLAHETGHWLDAVGIAPGSRGIWASAVDPNMAAWRDAVKNSTAIQTMQTWRASGFKPAVGGNTIRFRGQAITDMTFEGDGTIPLGIKRSHLQYSLQTHEVFARSYAQYVAIRSGDPVMLAELRRMQAQATTGPVAASTPMNHHPSGTEAGAALSGKTWDYPNVWSDADFKPIADAFDQLFHKLGWRKHGGG